MKKLLPLLGVFLIVSFFGCGDDAEEALVPPSNLSIVVAGSDFLSLKLSWDKSASEIDGYIIYFDGSPIDTATDLTCTHKPTSLGGYKVTAYKEDEESDPTSTISTKLVEDINRGPIYWTGAGSPADAPSGYGWSADGSGQGYKVGASGDRQNTDKIDFIIDSAFDLTQPWEFDNDFEHKTGIAYNSSWSYDNLAEAPQTGYDNFQNVGDGWTYALWVNDKYYVKLTITGVETGTPKSITFKYGFQKIAGFGRLK